jgi:very-short-patch-repair endonuclease
MRPAHQTEVARSLRRGATEPERRLWQILRGRRLGGLKFRRQMPIDTYFADFACLEARLIVEVDGSQHAASEADQVRDRNFAAKGFYVLRVWNNDVMTNPDGVAAEILAVAESMRGR